MIKILIGGSPCTFWSIAQKNNREVEAEGLGWELFRNYLIAKEKFKPDLFLYENNKSAAQPIKDQISRELGVELMHINSALVSAQNRQRFYAFNWSVEQPEDRGIYLADILQSNTGEKGYRLEPPFSDEPVCLNSKSGRGGVDGLQPSLSDRIYGITGKATAVTASYMTKIAEPVGVACRNRRENDGKLYRRYETSAEPKANALTTVQTDSMVAEPIRIGTIENDAKSKEHDSKQYRVYSAQGKSTTLCGEGGGLGAKTGLYAAPVEQPDDRPVYEVVGGEIEIKGKKFPIKLPDGFYIIRKLTPVECERLQTLPDNYTAAVSATQRYRGLGNGWTAEVIIHILNGALKDVPRDEEIVVLSMYDGIGTGRYCLEKMGFTNVTYYAYEIDGPAMKVALSNFPDIIQCGDAFDLRRDDWELGKKFGNKIATSTQENANDADGLAENKTEKEETTDDDSQSGEYPETETPTARGTAPSDSEGSVRESSDPGGVRGVEEGEGTEAEAGEPDGSDASGGDGEIDTTVRAIEEMQRSAEDLLKWIIIRDFESAMRKSGVEPDKELIEKLRSSSLMEVSNASLGFAGYIATATLNNSIKNL